MGGNSPLCSMTQRQPMVLPWDMGLPPPAHIHSCLSHQPGNIRSCEIYCCLCWSVPGGTPSTAPLQCSAVSQQFFQVCATVKLSFRTTGIETSYIHFLARLLCCFAICYMLFRTRTFRSEYNFRNPSWP